jgi:hypothetical protein
MMYIIVMAWLSQYQIYGNYNEKLVKLNLKQNEKCEVMIKAFYRTNHSVYYVIICK